MMFSWTFPWPMLYLIFHHTSAKIIARQVLLALRSQCVYHTWPAARSWATGAGEELPGVASKAGTTAARMLRGGTTTGDDDQGVLQELHARPARYVYHDGCDGVAGASEGIAGECASGGHGSLSPWPVRCRLG